MIKLTFENPIFLWYLLSIPLLIYTHFYLFRHAKVKAMQFANFEALKRVTGERLITKNIIILTLRVLTLTCVIMAATGAVFWYEGMVNENDFVIAIDVSASMTAQDVLPTRFDAAKNAALEFVDKLESKSNIGIITFSGTTLIETTLIDNKATVKKTIENLEITKTGGTDISGAIITGTNILLSSEKGKAIILYWSWDGVNYQVRWDRIGKVLK